MITTPFCIQKRSLRVEFSELLFINISHLCPPGILGQFLTVPPGPKAREMAAHAFQLVSFSIDSSATGFWLEFALSLRSKSIVDLPFVLALN